MDDPAVPGAERMACLTAAGTVTMSAGLWKNGGFTQEKFKTDVSSGAIESDAVNELKNCKVFSNPSDTPSTDTDSTCMPAKSPGLDCITDFTTETSGGLRFRSGTKSREKYTPALFK